MGAQFERRWSSWERARWRARRTPRSSNLLARALAATESSSAQPFDAAEQLRHVERAEFSARRLLNRGEARLFATLERICAQEAAGWRVMAQVSLGEILSSPNGAAYRAINSKRVDFLIVDADGNPLRSSCRAAAIILVPPQRATRSRRKRCAKLASAMSR
jgi:hypothetical protein